VSRRSDIFLADAIEGLATLEIRDPRLAQEVLRMLSLDRLEVGTATSLGGAFASPAAAPTAESARPQPATPPAPTQPQQSPPLTGARQATLRQITPPATQPRPPQWLVDVTAVPRSAGPLPPGPPPQPLFPREQTRALLTAAISTWTADGPLDVPRVIEMLASVEPIRVLPLETIASVRRGVQVLVDTGMGMGPYRADVDQVLRHLENVVADEQLRLLYFAGCPSRDCAAPGEDEMRPWLPPARGTPVMLFTDLGIGRSPGTEERAGVDEWLAFAERVATAGCMLIALVPYGPRRWPRQLARAMRIIHWDRRTTAAIVRRGLATPPRAPR
jgi:hypothetical protein